VRFADVAGFLSESLKRSRLIWRGCGFAEAIVSSCLGKNARSLNHIFCAFVLKRVREREGAFYDGAIFLNEFQKWSRLMRRG